jgi:hypothetical protein
VSAETELPEREQHHVGDVAALRAVIRKVANHEWIIATAFRDSTRDFGWQVNVRDGEPTAKGTQRYKPLPKTFAFEPWQAGLLGLAQQKEEG